MREKARENNQIISWCYIDFGKPNTSFFGTAGTAAILLRNTQMSKKKNVHVKTWKVEQPVRLAHVEVRKVEQPVQYVQVEFKD